MGCVASFTLCVCVTRTDCLTVIHKSLPYCLRDTHSLPPQSHLQVSLGWDRPESCHSMGALHQPEDQCKG